jgi:hypothetical protein
VSDRQLGNFCQQTSTPLLMADLPAVIVKAGRVCWLSRPDFLYGWVMYEALPHEANDQVHVDVDGLVIELAGLEVGLLDRFHDPCIPVRAD